MRPAPTPRQVECIADPKRAAALLHPTRISVLEHMREPRSAAEVAGRIGAPRQRVNHHVRALERSGFLRRAGKRRKRNMVEQRFVATARSYLIAPEVLGSAELDPDEIEDKFSAAYLLALSERLQGEVGRAVRIAEEKDLRLATLSVGSRFRFTSPEQRAAFGRALQEAVVDVIARHTAPDVKGDGSDGEGHLYRFMLGCWPVPAGPDDERPQGDPS